MFFCVWLKEIKIESEEAIINECNRINGQNTSNGNGQDQQYNIPWFIDVTLEVLTNHYFNEDYIFTMVNSLNA